MKITSCCITALIALALHSISTQPATAAVLIDNLDLPMKPGAVFIKSDQWLSVQFLTDSTTYRLDSASFNIYGSTEVPDLFGGIYADDGTTTRPGIEISPFLVPPGAIRPYGSGEPSPEFIPQTEVVLEPDTRYWIVLGRTTPGGPNPVWFQQESGQATGPASFTSRTASSRTQGSIWAIGFPRDPYQMRLEATVIPEPTSLLLAAAGIPYLLRRRQN